MKPELVSSMNLVCVCVSALAVPYLRSVDVSWCKVVGGRLALLLDALQPAVILELRLSSCELTSDDLRHLGNTHTHTRKGVFTLETTHFHSHRFISLSDLWRV